MRIINFKEYKASKNYYESLSNEVIPEGTQYYRGFAIYKGRPIEFFLKLFSLMQYAEERNEKFYLPQNALEDILKYEFKKRYK